MANDLVNLLADLKEQQALHMVQNKLDSGEDPIHILDDARKAMEIVGKRFEKGDYFISELMFAGEILSKISENVKPHLKKESSAKRYGKVIIGTVAGDIHDIGKNIVTFMLDLSGFEVFDLGVDVPIERFIKKIKETEAPVVGLSGFLTLAFDSMKTTIDAIKAAGLREKVKIIIGGGNINEDIKIHTGADAYGVDAMAGVAFAKKVLGLQG